MTTAPALAHVVAHHHDSTHYHDGRPTVADRVAEWGVRVEVVNSYLADPREGWHRDSWTHDVVLHVAGTPSVIRGFPYTMGSAYQGRPPTTVEVLDSYADAARDAAYTRQEYIAELGGDRPETQARASRSWTTSRRIKQRLLVVLGEARLNELLENTQPE